MTATLVNETNDVIEERPGAQLAAVRMAKGYSVEYVAQKMRLRGQLIQLLEADDYANMPDPVFVKGYLRAYAKLLEVNADPLLEIFNRCYCVERTVEKALWQSRRHTHHAERGIRWLTALFGLVVLAAVIFWWQKNKDNQALFATAIKPQKEANVHAEAEIRLTDLSKMRSILGSEVSSFKTEETTSD